MKSTWNILWKDWCWSWSFSTLTTWCKVLTLWKRPWCWERQEEKVTTEDEMDRLHHLFNGHEFEQTLGDGEGQGSLVFCSPWVAKSWTWLSDWTTTHYLFMLVERYLYVIFFPVKQHCDDHLFQWMLCTYLVVFLKELLKVKLPMKGYGYLTVRYILQNFCIEGLKKLYSIKLFFPMIFNSSIMFSSLCYYDW